MNASLQRRIQRYGWDRAAEVYERGWREQLAPAQSRLLDLAGPRPGEAVLDVACGTGLVTFPAAYAVGPRGRVVGVDLSGEMVRICREKSERHGLSQVDFRRMDAERLELPDGSFDLVLDSLGIMYVPDPSRALAEQLRVLAPGGRSTVAVWGRRDRCGWAAIFPIVDRRVRSEVCPLFFRLGTGEALRLEMERAGFRGIRVERLEVELEYGDADEALHAAFVGGPVAMAYSRLDDGVRAQVHDEYLDSIAAFRHGSGYRIPGEFVVARGERP
jgi:ubiquinone/menaquinone biosynthesis C-methylase UbiE